MSEYTGEFESVAGGVKHEPDAQDKTLFDMVFRISDPATDEGPTQEMYRVDEKMNGYTYMLGVAPDWAPGFENGDISVVIGERRPDGKTEVFCFPVKAADVEALIEGIRKVSAFRSPRGEAK